MATPLLLPTSKSYSPARGNGTDNERRPSRPSVQTGITTGVAFRVHQLTPPETPISPRDGSELEPAQALFHNYLRAFYPFDRSSTLLEGDDALLMTATIKPGDLILVHSVHANGWADGTVLTTGERGWLPTNYCEAYDNPYLRNLLNAMTQFWDLLGANEDANLSALVRQDYIRGLIAGVRYVLEHADCLHRDAALVLHNSGIRRMRKGLLADLSSLVQIARGLQETISEPFAGEVIHYLLEDLIAKAFKVVTRAVGFVDMWSKETSDDATEASTRTRIQGPPTPPLDIDALTIDTKALLQPALKQPVDSAKGFSHQEEQHDAIEGAQCDKETPANAQWPSLSDTPWSCNASISHRLSVIESDVSHPKALASTRLATAHDACISNIGAFIGHHLHSRPSSELVETTERLVNSCKGLLAVVDDVQTHDTRHAGSGGSVSQARSDFQSRLEELVKATKDVFKFSDFDDSNVVMLPDQTSRLVTVGTSLIRTAGECVTKTRALIEQIGDFRFDNPPPTPEKPSCSSGESLNGMSRPNAIQGNCEAKPMTSFEKRLSKRMLAPAPSRTSRLIDTTEATDFAVISPTIDSDTSSPVAPYCAASQKPLPPPPSVQRRTTSRMSQTPISGASLSGRISAFDGSNAARKDSVGVSIAGSTDTLQSSARHSGISAVSEVSTKATTPDQTKERGSLSPAMLNSFTSMSSMHSTATDSANDPETLLQRTYASELTLNKDGHVSGGSLPALIEQLTAHDSAPDPQFVSAFYLTFRMFTTPREFAQALVTRFDYVGDSKAVGTPVRLRIYNVFKGWLETYWNAAADKDALGEIRYFALHKLKIHLPSAGDRLLELTRKVAVVYQTGNLTGPLVSGVGKTSTSITAQGGQRGITPEPAVTKSQLNALRTATSGGARCNALELDPLELARQITLITSGIFCAIQPEELLSLEWSRSDTETARNVRAMCTINTDLAHLVGDTVLAPDDAKKRAAVIKHWSKVAARCLELNNYDSLMAIMCSINSSVVARLKRTWELVTKNTKTRLGELNTVIDFSRNQASLRRRLETPVAPCIPFLGIYLTDLTFLDAGNPKMRELPGAATEDGQTVFVINFDKHMRMAKVISHLQKFQVPYKLQPVPEMQAWMEKNLQRMRASTEDMVYTFHRRSLTVEPKQDDSGNKEKLEVFLKQNGFL